MLEVIYFCYATGQQKSPLGIDIVILDQLGFSKLRQLIPVNKLSASTSVYRLSVVPETCSLFSGSHGQWVAHAVKFAGWCQPAHLGPPVHAGEGRAPCNEEAEIMILEGYGILEYLEIKTVKYCLPHLNWRRLFLEIVDATREPRIGFIL